ncbi:MAG: amidohydrolase family protein [Thermoanaerobaculia bacterium]|nr:amidohydrolase family protein [Thermoanaerobaculia bacterium]
MTSRLPRLLLSGATFTLLLATGLQHPAHGEGTTVAFVGADILPIDGDPISDGVLIVRDGTIVAVGPSSEVQVPADADIRSATGKVIMPGLVDTHSHVGGGGGGDRSAPIQAGVRVYDSIDVRSAGFDRARAGGLTTINVMPGSGHLMSGQTVYLKLRDGNTIDDLTIVGEDGWIAGGMKMANGTNSRRDPPFPGTRGKSAALARAHYLQALEYQKKVAAAVDDPDKAPERDLDMEAMLEVLSGRRVVHHHTHRHDDILTVLRLQKEFGFRLVLQHVSEGWKVADEIAAAGVPASVIVIDSPGGKLEARDLAFETGAILDEAGVLVGFHTDDWITDSRLFLRSAALAVRGGMSRESALYAMTMAGAKILDLDDRIGSLTPGKDADFIVLSGDPLSVYTHVEETWIDGRSVFDRSRPEDRLIAVGGFGAGDPRHAHVTCFDDTEEGR